MATLQRPFPRVVSGPARALAGLARLTLLLAFFACATRGAQAPARACEPLEPDEHALIGRRGYDPNGCTRFERTAKVEIVFDHGIFNGLTPASEP